MRKRAIRRGLVVVAVAAVGATLPSAAWAASGEREPRTIDVVPGPNAIQRAIDRAHKGDTLVVHGGHYNETPIVDKRLKVVGDRGAIPVIDGQCAEDVTLDVRHKGVILGYLKVQGAAAGPGPGYAIDLSGISTAKVFRVDVDQTCGGKDRAAYGINIFDSGPLMIRSNDVKGGFGDAAIYVGGISDTRGAELLVKDNVSKGNHRGIIVEDSFVPTAQIKVIDNSLRENTRSGEGAPTGIFVHNSDHGLYKDNNTTRNGDYGIHIDAQSDDNLFKFNRAHENGVTDLFNEGSGNCGEGNNFGGVSGNALVPC